MTPKEMLMNIFRKYGVVEYWSDRELDDDLTDGFVYVEDKTHSLDLSDELFNFLFNEEEDEFTFGVAVCASKDPIIKEIKVRYKKYVV